MYRYDEFDHEVVQSRVRQFRGQVKRRLEGALTEDQFKPLRLQNGLYLQLHAYMLRIAVPYGTLNSKQLHKLADISEKYDRGYGHITTRQNMQMNWPEHADELAPARASAGYPPGIGRCGNALLPNQRELYPQCDV